MFGLAVHVRTEGATMFSRVCLLAILTLATETAWPQSGQADGTDDSASLKADLARERASLEQQRKALDQQEARLRKLEEKLGATNSASTPAVPTAGVTTKDAVATTSSAPAPGPSPSSVESVGEAPAEPDRPPPVAALGDQGGIITRRKHLTLEGDFEYAHADNNEVIFRGIEVPQSVLVGVFDINVSRQDILTAALVSRYGVTNRLEANVRLPYIYRTDASQLPPVDSSSQMSVGNQSASAHAFHLGDAEFGLRYQFTDGRDGQPFLIGGLQVLTPTGTSPYYVPRDTLGNPTRSATGAGFWAVEPTVTALLPSDPAVLFASLGYTYNFGRDINRLIGSSFIERVKPGGEPSFNLGVGISLNPRTAVSFAYAHTWSFGTKTDAKVQDASSGTPMLGNSMQNTARDLQIGQLIFGITYRFSEKRVFNWNVQIGATNDAPAVVTTFRVPVGFDL
jgi:hypothetical protein